MLEVGVDGIGGGILGEGRMQWRGSSIAAAITSQQQQQQICDDLQAIFNIRWVIGKYEVLANLNRQLKVSPYPEM